MPSTLDCPACHRKLRVPDELLGQQVRCPSCGTAFAGTPPEPPASPPGAMTGEPGLAAPLPAAPPAEQEVSCPQCGQRLSAGFAQCPFCGADLDGEEDERPWERRGRRVRRDCEPHRGPLILTLGVLSIVLGTPAMCCGAFGLIIALAGLGLGIPSWVMGRRDLVKMDRGVMDPEGRGITQGGMICGIVGTGLNLLGSLIGMLGLAYLVFVMHSISRMPPPAPPAPVPAKPAVTTAK